MGILSGYTECGSYVPLGINHGASDGRLYLSTIGQSCPCFIFFCVSLLKKITNLFLHLRLLLQQLKSQLVIRGRGLCDLR